MEESLKKLIDGNKRFAQGKSIHPNLGEELRNSLINEQKPFAAIIACSDSRVPVEIIFDAGIGDLFVIRNAGHVLSKETLGSLEYAVSQLGVDLVMILGHENCGAVKSALDAYNSEIYGNLSENLQTSLSHIYPFFENLEDAQNYPFSEITKLHVQYQLKDLLKKDPYLAKKVNDNKITLVGANYYLSTGLIEVFQ